jgi:hypothetical protein
LTEASQGAKRGHKIAALGDKKASIFKYQGVRGSNPLAGTIVFKAFFPKIDEL